VSVTQKNLTIYGEGPIPWSRALEQLDAGAEGTCWLATTRPDGRPHVAGVGALWVDGKFYVVTGARTRKGLNLAENPNCVISISLKGLDLVVEGTAAKVTDDATLRRLAKAYVDQGWPVTVSDGAFTAPYCAPSAGPPPWHLYAMTPTKAFGVATAEPTGATRWRFS
jgi:pyridoxamine 5'-phosphate oxidase-like protein